MRVDGRQDGKGDPLDRIHEDLLVRAGALIEDGSQNDPYGRKKDEGQRKDGTTADALTASARRGEHLSSEPPGPPGLITAKTPKLVLQRRNR